MYVHLGNKKLGDEGEYIGRPSPLGNPFPARTEEDRDDAIEKYQVWFFQKIDEGDERVVRELEKLLELARRPDGVVLLCWCYPKRCHGEIIKEVLHIMDELEG